MSMDYPFYEELRRLNHPGRHWWRAGDTLYYLGILPAMASGIYFPLAVIQGLSSGNWSQTLICTVTIIFGGAVWCIGARIKVHAYVLAERDGISWIEVEERRSLSLAAVVKSGSGVETMRCSTAEDEDESGS